MNFDFLKDLVNLNPIKTTYISNCLRTNFNFIVDDHIKDKNLNEKDSTLLEKLHQIFDLFLQDGLNKNLVYTLFGNKLDLTKTQFFYLYERIKEDMYINSLLEKICKIMDNNNNNYHSHETLKQHLLNTIDYEDGFANLSSFMIRECNSAAKIKN